MYEMLMGRNPYPSSDGSLAWTEQLQQLTDRREQLVDFSETEDASDKTTPGLIPFNDPDMSAVCPRPAFSDSR